MSVSKTRRILHLALPLILQQLCLQLQLWIDRAMLGHVNAAFFSAIGNTTVPYYMVSSTITAIADGTAILVAQNMGAANYEKVRETAQCSFLGSSILSCIAFLFFLCCSEPLFQVMGLQSPILEYSLSYIKILSVSLLILGPNSTATAIAQGVGCTKIIMISGIIGNLLNILLDWVLIFGKLSLPAMGIEGAALATVISNFVSGPLLIGFVFCSRQMPVKLRITGSLGQQLRQYGNVLKLGIPSGLEYALWNFGNFILVSFLNRLNMTAAGIYTLVFSIETVPLLIYMGFANAGLTLVGQNTGARDLKQARQAGFMCLGFSLIVCVLIGGLFLLIPRQLLSIFTNDTETLTTSVPYLSFIALGLFPKAINNVIGLCIRGIGDTRWMLYTQIFGTIFMISAGYILILCTPLGLTGIFITLIADEGLRSIANLLHFRSKTKN